MIYPKITEDSKEFSYRCSNKQKNYQKSKMVRHFDLGIGKHRDKLEIVWPR